MSGEFSRDVEVGYKSDEESVIEKMGLEESRIDKEEEVVVVKQKREPEELVNDILSIILMDNSIDILGKALAEKDNNYLLELIEKIKAILKINYKKDLKVKWTNGRLPQIQKKFWMVKVMDDDEKSFYLRHMHRSSTGFKRMEDTETRIKKLVPKEIWEELPSVVDDGKGSNIYISYFQHSGDKLGLYDKNYPRKDVVYVGETRLHRGGLKYTDPLKRWGPASGHLKEARLLYMKRKPVSEASTRIDAHLAFFDFDNALGVLFVTQDYGKDAEKRWIKKMKELSKKKGMNFVVVNK